MIMDNALEQTRGKFAKKCREAICHTRCIDPYSPWQDAAESCICELKRGCSRKMISKQSLKRLCDHAIEREAQICSHAALSSHQLDGKVPETKFKEQPADISNLCEFER